MIILLTKIKSYAFPIKAKGLVHLTADFFPKSDLLHKIKAKKKKKKGPQKFLTSVTIKDLHIVS